MELRAEQLSLPDLIGRCGEETGKFLRHELSHDSYCRELLRRAICDADGAAWQAVFAQYRGMVLSWVRRHPAAAAASAIGEDDDWVNRTFERFWSAVGPERFATFPNLAALLRYLKLCTHSVLLDAIRAQPSAGHADIEDHEFAASAVRDATAEVLTELARQDLWRAIGDELHDEAERTVARLCLTLDMKPREVFARYPQQFASVEEVYRVKRNLVDRLRRSQGIRAFLD